jgi:predicted amidophosphoribosyltransferase
MESQEIYAAFAGTLCAGCAGTKQRQNAFCKDCYRQLPRALQKCLWKRFGAGYEEAYVACLSWFRTHPFQGEHRAKQENLF